MKIGFLYLPFLADILKLLLKTSHFLVIIWIKEKMFFQQALIDFCIGAFKYIRQERLWHQVILVELVCVNDIMAEY